MRLGLHFELEQIEQNIILRLDGRLDAATSPLLEKKLKSLFDEHHHHLLIDFAHVDYLSSAGLRVLLSSARKFHEKKRRLILFSVQDSVFDVIKMAGFDKILHIVSGEKEALQSRS